MLLKNVAHSSRAAVYAVVALGLLVHFAACASQSQLTCKTLTPCSCKLLNNTSEVLGIIDISSFADYDWSNLTGLYDNKTYAYHPCVAGLQLPGTECTRQNQAAVCRQNDDGTFYSFGKVGTAEYEVTVFEKGEPLQLMATYTQGTASRIAQVLLTCAKEATNTPVAFKTNDAGMIASLEVFSPCACLDGCLSASSSASLSPGSILLILFVIVVVLYAVIGVMYKQSVRGAKGMEMIPNYSLWTNLPSLIADGIRFIFCQFSAQKGGAYESL